MNLSHLRRLPRYFIGCALLLILAGELGKSGLSIDAKASPMGPVAFAAATAVNSASAAQDEEPKRNYEAGLILQAGPTEPTPPPASTPSGELGQNTPAVTHAEEAFAIAPAGAARLPGMSAATPQTTTTLLLETFEGAFPSGLWSVAGDPTWDDTNYKPYNGSWSAWCADGGSLHVDPATSNYLNNMDAWMIYGPFSLVGALSGSFSFYYWLDSELGYDYLWWMVSTDGTNFYGYKLSGNSNGWVNTAIDLTSVPTLGNVTGQSQVWIALSFETDYSLTYKGAFVDDVRVEAGTTGSSPDLVAQQVYFRDQPSGGGSIVTNPSAGQTVYPHFDFRLDGSTTVSGKLWAIDVDGSGFCYYTGSASPGSYVGSCSAYVVPAGSHQLRGLLDPDGTITESNESNNQATKSFGQTATIDLAALQVYFRDQAGDQGNIVANPCVGQVVYPHIQFQVTGSGSATGTIVKLNMDGSLLCSIITTVYAGSTYVLYCGSPWTVTTGTHTLAGILDPDGAFVETNETNNQATKTVTDCQVPEIRLDRTSVIVECEDTSGAGNSNAQTAAPAVAPENKLLNQQDIMSQFAANGQGTARVIVMLKPPANAPAVVNLDDARSARQLREAIRPHQQAVLAKLNQPDYRLHYQFENQPSLWMDVTQAALTQLQKDPAVELIQPVYEIPMNLAQGLPLMGATDYRATYSGAGVSVAICDTGVDYTHPRLGGGSFPNAKVIGGYDMGDNDSNPMPDGHAHGTACAGIAAGNLGTVGDYIGGVAPDAKIYALKMTPASNPGTATNAAMAASWDWCVTHKNDNPASPIMVISTSFGGGRFYSACDSNDPTFTTAASNAVAAGITVLVSSGNDGYCDSIASPACISHVIAVGAVYDAAFGSFYPCVNASSCATRYASTSCSTGWYAMDTAAADRVTSYSNSASFVGVLAPSNQACTTDIVGSGGYATGDYDTGFGGTSAACPYAAGAVAALQSAAKATTGSFLTPAQVRQTLILTGNSVTDPKNSIVKPRVNLEEAIESLVPSNSDCITLYNDGSVALHVASVTRPAWATLVPPPPYTISGGGSQQVCVQACGSCAGTDLDGAIVINSDDPDESAVNVSVHVNCPAGPPQVSAWRSVRTHGSAGAIGLTLNATATGNGLSGPTVESRSGGIQKIEVDFSQSVVLSNTAGITVTGRTTTGSTLGGAVSYTPASASLLDANTLQILFNAGALPDQTCYTITLPANLVSAGLTGDRDVMVRSLYGDATMSGDIKLSDALMVKSWYAASVSAWPQCDLDLSGTIASGDAQAAKSRVALTCKKALCP